MTLKHIYTSLKFEIKTGSSFKAGEMALRTHNHV